MGTLNLPPITSANNPFRKNPPPGAAPNPFTGTDAPAAGYTPTPPPAASYLSIGMDDKQYEAEAKRVHDTLLKALSDVPDVNWEEKFAPLLAEQAKRTDPKPIDALTAFAGAIGAPGATSNAMSQRQADISNSRQSRENDILSLKQAILHGDITQLMQKGNFKKALAQADALHEIERATSKNEMYHNWRAFQNQNTMREEAAWRLNEAKIAGAIRKAQLIKGGTPEFNSTLANNIKTLASQAGVAGALYPDDQTLFDAAYRLTQQQLGLTTPPAVNTPPSGNTEVVAPDPERVRKMAEAMKATS